MKRGGVRPGAGRRKGWGRWGDAKTVNIRVPDTVYVWWEEFIKLVMDRHLEVEKVLNTKKERFDA